MVEDQVARKWLARHRDGLRQSRMPFCVAEFLTLEIQDPHKERMV